MMSRFITFTLLLLVFFFGGVSYGAFEKNNQPIETTEEEVIDEAVVIDREAYHPEPIQPEEENYFVHRTASFFEKIVTSLYEAIIHILYGIANLFFD